MASAVAGAGVLPPPGSLPLPGLTGGPPAARFYIRHLGRQLSIEDVAVGHTRYLAYREKYRTKSATMRVSKGYIKARHVY
jgi:hypothetical protein